jgi:hypothetical protein
VNKCGGQPSAQDGIQSHDCTADLDNDPVTTDQQENLLKNGFVQLKIYSVLFIEKH